jgi:hypothetical protein
MPSPQPNQEHSPAADAAYGPVLPGLADLDAVTAATVATMTDPAATRADKLRAAETEQAAYVAFERRPHGAALLKAGI